MDSNMMDLPDHPNYRSVYRPVEPLFPPPLRTREILGWYFSASGEFRECRVGGFIDPFGFFVLDTENGSVLLVKREDVFLRGAPDA